MKEKNYISNKKTVLTLVSSIFIVISAFNISHAFTPNASYTAPNGTVWTGLLVDLFTPSSSNNTTPITGGSPGFTGPSGFNMDGFTGQSSGLPPVTTSPSTDSGSGVRCTGQARNFRELIINLFIGCILSPLVYLIIAASVIVFLYGVFKFIRAEGDDKQAGREFIIYGIVGLFVMVSIWGLVSILSNTFNLNNSSITVPSLNSGL